MFLIWNKSEQQRISSVYWERCHSLIARISAGLLMCTKLVDLHDGPDKWSGCPNTCGCYKCLEEGTTSTPSTSLDQSNPQVPPFHMTQVTDLTLEPVSEPWLSSSSFILQQAFTQQKQMLGPHPNLVLSELAWRTRDSVQDLVSLKCLTRMTRIPADWPGAATFPPSPTSKIGKLTAAEEALLGKLNPDQQSDQSDQALFLQTCSLLNVSRMNSTWRVQCIQRLRV